MTTTYTPSPEQSQKNVQEFNKFLSNNNQLLQDKYKEYFVYEKIKIVPGKDPKIETVVGFIADVFSFEKNQVEEESSKKEVYKDGKGKNQSKSKQDQNNPSNSNSQSTIKTSLKNSYQKFLSKNKDLKQFNFAIAIEVLRFCIESNQMFAVQYETSKEAVNGGTEEKNNSNSNGKNNGIEMQKNLEQAYDGTIINDNHNKEQSKEHNNQFASMNTPLHNPNPPSNSEQNSNSNSNFHNRVHKNNSFLLDQAQLQNQFNFHQQIKLDLDPILVRKNIRIIYDYYCKQQMALAANLSFDRIQRESHMMTLGKVLLMARMMNVCSGVITKQCIREKFRKISEGKKEIDFKKFDILMNQLQIQDPTLIARAQLDSPKIHLNLKTTKKPFDTQDMLPRELIKNRNFTNKLTVHSGKMESDLKEDLKIRRSVIGGVGVGGGNGKEEGIVGKMSRIKMMEYYEEIAQKLKQKEKQKQKQRQKSRQRQQPQQSPSTILNRRQSEIINPKNLTQAQRANSHDISLLKLKKIIPIEHHQDDKWLGQYKLNSSIRRAQAYDDNRLSIERKRSFQGIGEKEREKEGKRNAVLIRELKMRVKQIERTEAESSGLDETKPYLGSPSRRY